MRWWAIAAVAGLCVSVARGDTLLHRQGPGRTFGVSSDSLMIDDFGNPTGELLADRFGLSTSDTICRINWWGFYGSSLAQSAEPPPGHETIRIRFYDDASGLPGGIVSEGILSNVSRQPTGSVIPTGAGLPEFRYQAQLPDCFVPQSGISYWIEIAQLDDIDSRFRWENSNTAGEFAVQFPIGSEWHLNSNGQLAYELWTPEPGSGVLVGLVGLVLRRRGKCG